MMQNEKKVNDKGSMKEKKSVFKNIGDRLRGRDDRQVRERLAFITRFFLVAAASYLISGAEAPFGVFPLAIALVCSAGRLVFSVVIGILPRFILGEIPIIYIFVCFATLMIRILSELWPRVLAQSVEGGAVVRYKDMPPQKTDVAREANGHRMQMKKSEQMRLLCEPMHVKVLSAALGGVLCGLFLLIEQEYSFYSLWAALSLTVISPFAVVALGGIFGEERYRKEWYRLLSLCIVVALCTYSAAAKTLLGMPMSPFLAMLFTLYLCSDRGMIYGLCVAAACGVAFDLRYVLLLVLSAVLFCLVSSLKRNAGLAAVCASVVVWCYYIGGTEGLVSVLPPMLLAIPFYMLADKYREMMVSSRLDKKQASGIYFAEAVTEKNKNQAVKERLSALSEAFSSLSENFYKLSDRFRRPDALGIGRIAEAAFDDVCSGCRNREMCWGAEYAETLEAIRCVAASLHTYGGADLSCLPDGFSARCLNSDKIISKANASVTEATEKMIGGGKIGLFASNYDDITALLKDALECDGEEYECDMEASEKIYEYLRSLSIDVGGVVVYGKRCRHVVVKGVSVGDGMGGAKAIEICREVEKIIGSPLTDPVFEVCNDGNLMLMYSRPRFRAVCAHGRLPSAELSRGDELYVDPFAKEEDAEMCGDTTDAFITDTSYFYSLISDGMGSGAEAAFTSGVCAMFIEKMLSAGNRADITLRMLNNVIRSENMGCGSECSATVDLLELDLMSGVASFIKSGAAPTYIAREGTVYKISSRTMPVGIIKDADARITKFDTKTGDVIVMISDGCSPDSDDCTWLVEYLCARMPFKIKKEDPSSFCEMLKNELLDEAVKNYPAGRERDDISVSVTLIR